MDLPKNYDFKKVESKLVKFWVDNNTYKFKSGGKVYSVDTPPPTLSGRMHLGHSFSYSQQDFIVRYNRMKYGSVFYPFGTDDNGLPTERMVEKLKKVKSVKMHRTEFIKLCNKTLDEMREDFICDWKNIGISCDYSETYSTINKHSIRTAQKSFLDLYKKDLVYREDFPTVWCVNCQTAIAQAELNDKELDSKFVHVNFDVEDGNKIEIATTRPELIPACVTIFVHPDDKRYKNLVGKKVKVPLFNQEVEIKTDESCDMEKGSGALMVCSYGDRYDVEAINKYKLKPRIVFTKDGKLNSLAGNYEGLDIKEGRKKIIDDLKKEGYLIKTENIKHNVNVHDKCGAEIEFLSSKQWFIKVIENKEKFVDAGNNIKWYPKYMQKRYDNWVNGLNWDWCISRQRHFGVPIPVWYCKKCSEIIVASENEIPVDPLEASKKCSKCKTKLDGEKDVFDTWMTSSVSPQIALNWFGDSGYDTSMKMYPMSLRPQAHDIIRTWTFYTIVKGVYHQNEIPWKDVVISGHVLDSKGESMHKSKGNVVDPAEVLDKYGADALRFWAASSKLGEDLRYLEKDLVTGRKTVTKLWNASKFCFMFLENYKFKETKLEVMDKWILNKLNEVIKESTKAFDEYEYSKAKNAVELFFWKDFCDNYLEIVKDRLYNGNEKEKMSGQFALYKVLESILKMFAPIMPFITEEIYQIGFSKESIHLSKWPKAEKIDDKVVKLGDKFVEVLSYVRQEKSKHGKSLKDAINVLVCSSELSEYERDLKAVTKAAKIEFADGRDVLEVRF